MMSTTNHSRLLFCMARGRESREDKMLATWQMLLTGWSPLTIATNLYGPPGKGKSQKRSASCMCSEDADKGHDRLKLVEARQQYFEEQLKAMQGKDVLQTELNKRLEQIK